MVIKEWGVRFPLPDKLQNDAYYDYSTTAAAQDPSIVIEAIKLRSKTLDRITAGCQGIQFYLAGGITRSKIQLTAKGYPYGQPELSFVNLAGYWYDTFSSGNEAVATQKCAEPNAVSKEKDDFLISIGGAQSIYDHFHKLEIY